MREITTIKNISLIILIYCALITQSLASNIIAPYSLGNTYYIDAINGSDSNDGLTETTAWQTIDKVNTITYQAGDAILFKSGQEFMGKVKPSGNGTPENPIVIGKYGGDTKPIINAINKKACIHISNLAGWEIQDLELISDGGLTPDTDAVDYRAGVAFDVFWGGAKKHFVLRNLKIHKIYASEGTLSEWGTPKYVGHGIHFNGFGENLAYFEDITIENCHIENVASNGISLNHWNYDLVGNVTSHRNVNILNNTIEYIGGPGIVPMHINNLLVEGNFVNYTGAYTDPRMYARGSGIWPLRCEDVLIQNNKFMHARGEGDSCGAHIDIGNKNVTIQYNLSYDNEGGFVELMGANENSIYRYNVSINDGSRVKGVTETAGKVANQHGAVIWLCGYMGRGEAKQGSHNTQIYNNTVYVASNITPYFEFDAGNTASYIENNIFYLEGTTHYINEGSEINFNNNIFYGASSQIEGLPYGANDIFADPMLTNPGGLTIDDYLLLTNSPAVNTGIAKSNAGSQDLWGDALSTQMLTDIGADETAFNPSMQTITATFGEGGTVYPSGTISAPAGSDFPITIIAEEDNLIDKVYVDGNEVSIGSGNNYTFNNLSGNHTIHVDFSVPLVAPVINDPIDNTTLMYDYSSNVTIYTGAVADFNGDAGRFSRTNLDTGYIAYNLEDISTFSVEYWTWKYGGEGTFKIYGSTDGVTYEEVTLSNPSPLDLNSRYMYTYSPATDISSKGYNYLKAEITGGDGNWKDQIGHVSITGTIPVASVSGVSLSSTDVTLNVGDTHQLTANITPIEAENHNVTWSSNNTSAVSIDANGLLTAVGGGIAVITATTEDGGFTAQSTVISTSTGAVSIPSNLTASPTDNEAVINWTEGNNTTYHRIQYKLDGSPWITIDSIFNANPDEYTLTDLEAGKNYMVRIRAYSATNASAWSTTLNFTTTNNGARQGISEQMELPQFDLNIYPNPANSFFMVNFGNVIDNGSIQIFSAIGKLERILKVHNSEELKFDINDLSKGIYFIKVSSDQLTMTKRLIIR